MYYLSSINPKLPPTTQPRPITTTTATLLIIFNIALYSLIIALLTVSISIQFNKFNLTLI